MFVNDEWPEVLSKALLRQMCKIPLFSAPLPPLQTQIFQGYKWGENLWRGRYCK